jgi:hypothetical protein
MAFFNVITSLMFVSHAASSSVHLSTVLSPSEVSACIGLWFVLGNHDHMQHGLGRGSWSPISMVPVV